MYRYSPQTLHLFSSQITQTCHTIALLGPAKKVHQILLCWIYASFIPSLKNETDRFGSISRILEILRSPSPQHIQITKKTIALNVAEIRISPIKTDLRCENSFRAPLLQIHHRQRHQLTAVSSLNGGTRRTRIIFEPLHRHCMRIFFVDGFPSTDPNGWIYDVYDVYE